MGIFDSSRAFGARCVGISNEGLGVARIEEQGAKEDGLKVFVEEPWPLFSPGPYYPAGSGKKQSAVHFPKPAYWSGSEHMRKQALLLSYL